MAVVHAPLGDGEGEQGVDGHRAECHQGEGQLVTRQQDDRHQGELHQHRQDAEGQIIHDGADRARAPLQVAADGPALAPQVVAQGQAVQVRQHPGGQAAHGPVAHPGEDDVPQFVEQGGGELEQAIGQEQAHRQDQHLILGLLEGVDDLLEHQGHADGRHLGQHQAGQGQQGAPAKFPQIGQHRPEVVGIAPVLVDPFGGVGDHGAVILAALGPIAGPGRDDSSGRGQG